MNRRHVTRNISRGCIWNMKAYTDLVGSAICPRYEEIVLLVHCVQMSAARVSKVLLGYQSWSTYPGLYSLEVGL